MVYVTSDTHFLHPKIVEICNRPTTKEEHDEWLIDIWNSTINKKDEVYHLGDFSLGNREKSEKILDRLHGKKYLIKGNHDESVKNSTRWQWITQIKRIKHLDKIIILCHYPFASWDMQVHGSLHFYGHVHGRFSYHPHAIDVGIDAQQYKIKSIDELLEQIK